ncbi:MAG: hypothetical protein U9M90_04120 [Patescibacteria group bacterium]|nr:hypothetical protein [Patescibacteria group bacterium]
MFDTFIALGTIAVCLIGTQLIKRRLSDASNGSKEFILKHRLLPHPNSISFTGLLWALFSMALYWFMYAWKSSGNFCVLSRLLNRIFDLELSMAANYFGKIKTVCVHSLIVFCALEISNVIASGFLTAITFLAVCSITFKFIRIGSLRNFISNRRKFSRCKLF